MYRVKSQSSEYRSAMLIALEAHVKLIQGTADTLTEEPVAVAITQCDRAAAILEDLVLINSTRSDTLYHTHVLPCFR